MVVWQTTQSKAIQPIYKLFNSLSETNTIQVIGDAITQLEVFQLAILLVIITSVGA